MITRRRWRGFGIVAAACLLVAGSLAGGCSSTGKSLSQRLARLGDPRLEAALRASLEAAGGVEPWSQWRQMNAEAVATVFEPDGSRTLIEQQYSAAWGKRLALRVASREPTGATVEDLDAQGRVRLMQQTPEGELPITDPQQLYAAAVKLRLLSAALTPATLLSQGLVLQYEGQEHQGGRVMHRIAVTGELFGRADLYPRQQGNLLVVWIDAQTGRLLRLWLRYHLADGQYGYLSAQVNDYQAAAGTPCRFPRFLDLARSDAHQVPTQNRLMAVELSRVEANRTPPR